MNGPMPQDAPDPFRPGWVPPPPVSASLPPYPPPPRPVYSSYPAPGLPPYGGPPFPYAVPRHTSSDAIISLICPILAIIFGIRAKRKIQAAYGALDGGGMANAGIILGGAYLALMIIGGLVFLLVFAFLVAGFATGMAVHRL